MTQSRTRTLRCLTGWMALVAVAVAAGRAPANQLLQREGKHIRLTTDLANASEAESLVASFDRAVTQWAAFWELPDDALSDWKVDAFVIRNRAEFDRRNLIPADVPNFPYGYALGNQVFVLAQQSQYYTRHLLLHEGVHSLAYFHFGGAGPTWFQEGTAELLATHQGSESSLNINQIPANREAVPYWGRFKMISQLRQQRSIPTLFKILRYQPNLRDNVESYSCSWAAVMLLDMYPEYRQTVLDAARFGTEPPPNFNRRVMNSLQKQLPAVIARWRLMAHQLDYGFDRSREQVSLSVRDPAWRGQPIRVQIAADRGWQSIGMRVPGNTRLRVKAGGRVTLANDPKPWVSEPPGITFQYERGRPVGQLLVCVLPNASDPQAERLEPLEVYGLDAERTLQVNEFSWLLFRVNDAVGDLGNNSGQYTVELTRQ